jgi:hypothetical protein
MPSLQIKRGTRAQLNAAATANQLRLGEPYLIIDENRIAIGLSTNTYEVYHKRNEPLNFANTQAINGLAPAIASGQPTTYEQVLQPRRAGLFITPSAVQYVPTTATQAANSLRAWPFKLDGYRNFAGIRSEVGTLLAGANYRMGLYSDNGSAYPGALLANSDNGDISAATAGLKNFTQTITAPTEWIWAVFNSSAAISMRAIPVSALEALLGAQGNGGANHCFTAWAIAQAFGPLPATFPAGATLQANATCPWIALTTA